MAAMAAMAAMAVMAVMAAMATIAAMASTAVMAMVMSSPGIRLRQPTDMSIGHVWNKYREQCGRGLDRHQYQQDEYWSTSA